MKFKVIVILLRPSESTDTGAGPVSVDETNTAFCVSFPLGIVMIGFSSFPFVAVILMGVSAMAAMGFPFLSSS